MDGDCALQPSAFDVRVCTCQVMKCLRRSVREWSMPALKCCRRGVGLCEANCVQKVLHITGRDEAVYASVRDSLMHFDGAYAMCSQICPDND